MIFFTDASISIAFSVASVTAATSISPVSGPINKRARAKAYPVSSTSVESASGSKVIDELVAMDLLQHASVGWNLGIGRDYEHGVACAALFAGGIERRDHLASGKVFYVLRLKGDSAAGWAALGFNLDDYVALLAAALGLLSDRLGAVAAALCDLRDRLCDLLFVATSLGRAARFGFGEFFRAFGFGLGSPRSSSASR